MFKTIVVISSFLALDYNKRTSYCIEDNNHIVYTLDSSLIKSGFNIYFYAGMPSNSFLIKTDNYNKIDSILAK